MPLGGTAPERVRVLDGLRVCRVVGVVVVMAPIVAVGRRPRRVVRRTVEPSGGGRCGERISWRFDARVTSAVEDSHSGLVRALGKRVGLTPSGVRIPYPPPASRAPTTGRGPAASARTVGSGRLHGHEGARGGSITSMTQEVAQSVPGSRAGGGAGPARCCAASSPASSSRAGWPGRCRRGCRQPARGASQRARRRRGGGPGRRLPGRDERPARGSCASPRSAAPGTPMSLPPTPTDGPRTGHRASSSTPWTVARGHVGCRSRSRSWATEDAFVALKASGARPFTPETFPPNRDWAAFPALFALVMAVVGIVTIPPTRGTRPFWVLTGTLGMGLGIVAYAVAELGGPARPRRTRPRDCAGGTACSWPSSVGSSSPPCAPPSPDPADAEHTTSSRAVRRWSDEVTGPYLLRMSERVAKFHCQDPVRESFTSSWTTRNRRCHAPSVRHPPHRDRLGGRCDPRRRRRPGHDRRRRRPCGSQGLGPVDPRPDDARGEGRPALRPAGLRTGRDDPRRPQPPALRGRHARPRSCRSTTSAASSTSPGPTA